MNTWPKRLAGWAAVLSGVAGIVVLVTSILFFAIEANSGEGRLWGPLSDLSPIVQMGLLVVVAPALYVIERSVSSRLSLLATFVGIAGMVGVVLLQTLLLMGIIPIEKELPLFTIAAGLVGVWLIVVNFIGLRQRSMSPRLAWLGIAVGLAYAFEPVIAIVAGEADIRSYASNPLLMVASAVVFVVGYFGFPVWAIWLGRLLLGEKAGNEVQPKVSLVPPAR